VWQLPFIYDVLGNPGLILILSQTYNLVTFSSLDRMFYYNWQMGWKQTKRYVVEIDIETYLTIKLEIVQNFLTPIRTCFLQLAQARKNPLARSQLRSSQPPEVSCQWSFQPIKVINEHVLWGHSNNTWQFLALFWSPPNLICDIFYVVLYKTVRLFHLKLNLNLALKHDIEFLTASKRIKKRV